MWHGFDATDGDNAAAVQIANCERTANVRSGLRRGTGWTGGAATGWHTARTQQWSVAARSRTELAGLWAARTMVGNETDANSKG